MNFYELFFIFLQFLLVALSGAFIFVLFLIARSKADKSLINVDEKGLLNEKKIKEIARQNFDKANDSDIETWLHDAITAWFDGYKVSSFAPFQHFFPDTQDTAKHFARILQALPNEKSSGKAYSIHSQFRRALTAFITTKAIYLKQSNIWLFALDLARQIRLHECAGSIILILKNKDIKENIRDKDNPLFDIVLKMSFSFDPKPDVLKLWQYSIEYIDEAPHLSTQLLARLVDTDPLNSCWADYALQKNMKKALLLQYESQEKENDAVHKKQFEGIQSQLSSLITDNKTYYEGVEKLIYEPLECLVNVSRVKSLIKSCAPSRESEKAQEPVHRLQPNKIRDNVKVHLRLAFG